MPEKARYDSDGLRVSKTVNNVKHNYYYVEGKLVYEDCPSYKLFYLYDALGNLAQIKRIQTGASAETFDVVCNSFGDVIALYEGGDLLAKYTYDSWGKLISIIDWLGQDVTTTNDIWTQNSIRYRGYVYDTETELYYLQSRYYDPETCRFINADCGIIVGGGAIQGDNLFSYCNNNPIIFCDLSGAFPTASQILFGAAFTAGVVALGAFCIATAGVGAAALVGGGSMLLSGATATAAAVATVAAEVCLISTGAAVSAKIIEETIDRIPHNYTVYGLEDNSGNIEYVGRTKNLPAREAAHKRNPNRKDLNMVILAPNLTAVQARGVEQIYMLHYHTINTFNKMNNQINGISPANPQIGLYMAAARGFFSYIDNQISDEFLYWTGY